MNINNTRVYDLTESLVASGYPMLTSYADSLEVIDDEVYDKHLKRLVKLANTPIGSGHSNALSGIIVSIDITATVKWWEQFQRYHFKQIVSSMSTMHRLRQMLEQDVIRFNPNTPKIMIDTLKAIAKDPNITDEQLAYACPMGLELTARVTTNYLQLKTIYSQRHNHKLSEWKEFCEFIGYLPYADDLIICGNKEN
jgi:hypothetical protein